MAAEAKATKAKPQSVRAEPYFFEPPLQNIWAESLEPQNFPDGIFKLSVMFVYSSSSCKVQNLSLWNLDASQEQLFLHFTR